MKIGAAYVRVSDERQDEYSPDSQRKLIIDYAKKNDYLIPEEFIFYDDGISGKSVKRRTQFQEMIAHAKNKEFEAIFVWKFSRFARNQEESILYKNLLKKYGVTVISISEPIANDVYGSLIERIIEWMDEFYLIRLSGEVKRGMTERRSRGEPVSPAPFGYDNKDNTFVQNDEAAWVKRIFEEYASGEKVLTITKRLGADGIKTKFGGIPDNRFIEYILNNPAYIGKLRYSENGNDISDRFYYNAETVEGHHEPIIPGDLWDRVQARLKRQKQMYGKWQRKEQSVGYMLKGIVRCSGCGATLIRQGSKCPILQCHNYVKGACRESHGISLSRANKAVVESLTLSLGRVAFRVDKVPTERDKVDYTRLIEAEERKLERAKQAYLAGVDTLEEYNKHKQSIVKIIESYQVQEPEEATEDYSSKVREVLEYIQSSETEEKKNRVLRTIISKIIYNKREDSLEIYYIQ